MDALVFELEGQRFGVDLDAVKEVVRAVATDHLPGAPAIVEGVINYRGTIVPVLDIRARFGLPPRPAALSDHLIVARAQGRTVAIRVDRSGWPLHVPDLDVADLTGSDAETLRVAGVAKLPDGVIVIHDLDRFLTARESQELTAALADVLRGSTPS